MGHKLHLQFPVEKDNKKQTELVLATTKSGVLGVGQRYVTLTATTNTLSFQPHTHKGTHIHSHVCAQQIPPNSCFISRPKAFILRFPSTEIIMSQASIKASSSHDRLRQACRSWFCCFTSGFLSIVFRTPSPIIFLCLSWYIIVFASTHSMNLSLNLSRTSCAAQKEKTYDTQTHALLKLTVEPSSSHFEHC